MAVVGHYFDGIGVIVVGGVGDEGCHKFAEVFTYVFAVSDACNIELDVVYTLIALILWPDAYVVAFVLDAEVAEFLDWYIFVVVRTDDYTNARSFRLPNTVI
jgi:hypothetical protein